MFGGKNKVSAEEVKILKEKLEEFEGYLDKVKDAKKTYNAGTTSIEGSRKQLDTEIVQVKNNVESVIEFGTTNVETEASLMHDISDYKEQMQTAESEYKNLKDKLEELNKSSQVVVEGNKHFTTPSKKLSELASEIKSQNQLYLEQLKMMSANCKQMGVLALNAAIEAGRMGESGKQFVSAAEEIRNFAGAYEVLISNMNKQIEETDAKVSNLEDCITNIVKNLKESNVSAVKHMKECQNTLKYVDSMSMREFSQDIDDFKDQILGIKNAEDEVLKFEERNKLQLEDMAEELKTQRKEETEIMDKLKEIFDCSQFETESQE
ncbi:MAG: methyl-accepting chemotaxis protein [Agathobacter sp.]|nr:methyl-accepting chemotaxis protein [Agathobacter sp.]